MAPGWPPSFPQGRPAPRLLLRVFPLGLSRRSPISVGMQVVKGQAGLWGASVLLVSALWRDGPHGRLKLLPLPQGRWGASSEQLRDGAQGVSSALARASPGTSRSAVQHALFPSARWQQVRQLWCLYPRSNLNPALVRRPGTGLNGLLGGQFRSRRFPSVPEGALLCSANVGWGWRGRRGRTCLDTWEEG